MAWQLTSLQIDSSGWPRHREDHLPVAVSDGRDSAGNHAVGGMSRRSPVVHEKVLVAHHEAVKQVAEDSPLMPG